MCDEIYNLYIDLMIDVSNADDYFLSRLPIVETRIAQGGFRLAALLNQIFGTEIHEKKSLISEAWKIENQIFF